MGLTWACVGAIGPTWIPITLDCLVQLQVGSPSFWRGLSELWGSEICPIIVIILDVMTLFLQRLLDRERLMLSGVGKMCCGKDLFSILPKNYCQKDPQQMDLACFLSVLFLFFCFCFTNPFIFIYIFFFVLWTTFIVQRLYITLVVWLWFCNNFSLFGRTCLVGRTGDGTKGYEGKKCREEAIFFVWLEGLYKGIEWVRDCQILIPPFLDRRKRKHTFMLGKFR